MELTEPVKKYTHAGFWIRVGAYIIDTIILLPFVAFSFYNMLTLKSFPLALLVILLTTAYKPLLEYYYGATLGKKAVNIKVLDDEYNPIDFKLAIERYLPWLVAIIVNLIVISLTFMDPEFSEVEGFMEYSLYQKDLGYDMYQLVASLPVYIAGIAIAFNKLNLGLHDQYAGTCVVYTDR